MNIPAAAALKPVAPPLCVAVNVIPVKVPGKVVFDNRASDVTWANVRHNDRICVFRSRDSSSLAVVTVTFRSALNMTCPNRLRCYSRDLGH